MYAIEHGPGKVRLVRTKAEIARLFQCSPATVNKYMDSKQKFAGAYLKTVQAGSKKTIQKRSGIRKEPAKTSKNHVFLLCFALFLAGVAVGLSINIGVYEPPECEVRIY